jgi:putative glutamine amidotransferase
MHRRIKAIAFFLLVSFSLFAQKEPQPLRIALSKAAPNYINWIHSTDSLAKTVNLYKLTVKQALDTLRTCSGLLITGGEDVYPGLYGLESELNRTTGCDRYRDSLELAVLDLAMKLGMPVLGICRGHQLINVYLGGVLIVDIPSETGSAIKHMCSDYLHCEHIVKTDTASLLYRISGTAEANVASNHHQAVKSHSTLLRVNATSADGLIEGTEWNDPKDRNFLLTVQWHPERMERSNPLSGRIAGRFISECHDYQLKKITR